MNQTTDAAFERATRLHGEGDLTRAIQAYRAVLGAKPAHYDAAYLLAVALYQSGQVEKSLTQYAQAILVDPRRTEAHRDRGLILLGKGAHAEALADFDAALLLEPKAADLHVNRGICLKSLGRLSEAIESYRKAIELQPDFPEAHNNLGSVLLLTKDLEGAITSFGKALSLRPTYAEAHRGLGTALLTNKDVEGALPSFRQAIALKRDDHESWANMALAFHLLSKSDKALEAIDKGLAICGPHATLCVQRGMVLRALDLPEKAVSAFRSALLLSPKDPRIHQQLGAALSTLGHQDEALASYDRAIEIDPSFARAHRSRGGLMKDLSRLDEALASYSQALVLEPDYETLQGGVCFLARQLCDWAISDPLSTQIIEGLQNGKRSCTGFHSIVLFDDPQLQLQAARLQSASFPHQQRMNPTPKGRREQKIRIAYFSSDFSKDHPMSKCIGQVITSHDHGSFEVTGITYGKRGGHHLDTDIIGSLDRHTVIEGLDSSTTLDALKQLDFDIAIDLNGYTVGSRSALFASRLAPVQVNFLGYPGTMGASFMDYVIADRRVIPPEAEEFYDERPVLMPYCYFPYSATIDLPEPSIGRNAYGLPDDAFVFFCFNRLEKLGPRTFDLWMRVLRATPGSVLWLLSDQQTAMKNLQKEAVDRGIDPKRLVFAPRVSSIEHLSRQKHADLFLDTLPYNAHTTACDALWAGVPLITLTGRSFAGRVATSMLHAAGLDQLVTNTEEEFVDLAVSLARDRERLTALRSQIEREKHTMPLFASAGFTRALEWAYREMHERQVAGLPPAPIHVPDMKGEG